MRVAFLVNDLQLSGGVGVVVQHARQLSTLDGWDVSLVLVREQEDVSWSGYTQLPHLHVRSRAEALAEHYDVAVATWWETTFSLFELSADRYVYFLQSLEDRFYQYDEAERLGAALTLDLPVAFITEASWIVDSLAGLRPDAPCHLVRNGIDKHVYGPLAELPPSPPGPLRLLVEGSPNVWFKHVLTAIDAVSAMSEPRHLTVVSSFGESLGNAAALADAVVGPLTAAEMAALYAQTDVVLKLSSVEGMFGPPLEGFHRGATCVVTPVTGHEEYVKHGWNGLLTDWDDRRGTARQLDLLARDRTLLAFLRENALETARSWPSWEESNRLMAEALLDIRRRPQPAGGTARMLEDLREGLDAYAVLLRERAEYRGRMLRFERRLRRLRNTVPVRAVLALRRYRLARFLARPLVRRVRRIGG